jgi:hypothetical protein
MPDDTLDAYVNFDTLRTADQLLREVYGDEYRNLTKPAQLMCAIELTTTPLEDFKRRYPKWELRQCARNMCNIHLAWGFDK